MCVCYRKELSRLPTSESLDSAALPDSSPMSTSNNGDPNTLSQQPSAACLPSSAPSVPHTYILGEHFLSVIKLEIECKNNSFYFIEGEEYKLM